MCLGQICIQYLHADPEVGLIEVVRHVPSNLTVLATFLDYGMKEPQDEYQWFERLVRAVFKHL